MGENLTALIAVAAAFDFGGKVLNVQRYGSGNVNDTFLVTLDGGSSNKAILQRVNRQVFRRPELIILNMRALMDHLRATAARQTITAGRRWETPDIVPTRDGADYFVDGAGGFWRATTFIAGAQTYNTVQSCHHAEEVGYALGQFHSLISDLPVEKLHDTLEGFHITPRYLAHYDEVLAGNGYKPSPEVHYALNFVAQRRRWAAVLEDAVARGELTPHPIHGDPKVDNVMIDDDTGQAVSLIDLDTLKPGLVHYDIGDCLRSCCNPLGEETDAFDEVKFETDLCAAILKGYLSQARHFLNGKDYEHIYNAVRLIAFELGLRFFTDYLEGNVYFKTKDTEHNLRRALVQFRLMESIEAQADAIQAIIHDQQ
ncbi:MAG TPA: aminoglycoside phosphotransferase family protein [Anaerolineae bacterium]|mgnify:CR=1 FL=1|nr:aminoglycoside phosphotransferase family protein [Anaerolineae bacterium]HQK13828.1 aminoglycoside phosphotransferase family protein [Anaerolineae bacterium]